MRQLLIPLLAALALPTAVKAEVGFLIIKSRGGSNYNALNVDLIAIPMNSMKSCEEAGLKIISSDRFDLDFSKDEAFECIVK